jgi:hypothetical protein
VIAVWTVWYPVGSHFLGYKVKKELSTPTYTMDGSAGEGIAILDITPGDQLICSLVYTLKIRRIEEFRPLIICVSGTRPQWNKCFIFLAKMKRVWTETAARIPIKNTYMRPSNQFGWRYSTSIFPDWG